jgi:hypothetical protein
MTKEIHERTTRSYEDANEDCPCERVSRTIA